MAFHGDFMTVGELVALLLEQDQSMPVGFQYQSGDYWRTIVVATPDGVSEENVAYTSYHSSYALVDPEDADEETETWVVIG